MDLCLFEAEFRVIVSWAGFLWFAIDCGVWFACVVWWILVGSWVSWTCVGLV